MFISKTGISLLHIGYGCDWTPIGMRRSYEDIVAFWTDLGIPPNQLAAKAPGVRKKWGAFRHKRKRLELTNFESVESISLAHLIKKGRSPETNSLFYATISTGMRYVFLGSVPAAIGVDSSAIHELFRKVATAGRVHCGSAYLQGPAAPPFSFPKSSAERDLHRNSTSWFCSDEKADLLLLPNVCPHNYLSDAHLNAPFGKTGMTLREWIEANPGERGKLKPFTDILTEWTPPEENIPEIREQLFRAGRLFYWRFFVPPKRREDASPVLQTGLANDSWQEPELYYRPNIHEPWEATEPIPEIFRAEFYRDFCKDKGKNLAS